MQLYHIALFLTIQYWRNKKQSRP